jgi:hypothetical protein
MEAADRDGHVFVGHAGMGRDPGARRAWSEKRGPQGPGPSVEERLAQLERAVREMHEMFARHDVPPEMRERAEREMRERRGDRPPMGERVVVLPLAPDGPRRAPVPIAPRGPEAAGTFKIEMQRDVAEELKRFAAAQQEQVASLQKQLADTQAQLKKAMDELEALKAKQTTK